MKRTLFVALLAVLSLKGLTAQQRVVVADADSRAAVAHASIYTHEGSTFRSAITNEQGVAVINFAFQRLTVSHLNYERRVVQRLADTIWLKPKYRATSEVIVTNKEPEWIRPKLKQVVKLKRQYYFSRSDTLAYDYRTQSIGNRSIYRYRQTGWMQPRSIAANDYSILLEQSEVEAIDTTRLTDTSNLRRMLYEDFVAELDNGFIRSHRFYVNHDYEGRSPAEVELRFRSKNHNDDRGWLVVDTARCVVLQAYRFTGTKTNRQERVSAFMYAAARLFGYRIDTWTRDYRVAYGERADGTFYPATVNYKMYYACHDGDTDQREADFDQQTGGGFPNMEATLSIGPRSGSATPADTVWHWLCPSWYIKYNTENERRQEIELSNLPATFKCYADEP